MTSSHPDLTPGKNTLADTAERFENIIAAAPLQLAPKALLADRYELIEKIGSGGMALLYAGKDLVLSRRVAIKLLDRNFVDDTAIRRFQQEAKAASGLDHPNLVTVHDFGQDSGRPFLVMDLIEGEPLSAVIKREGQIEQDTVVGIALDVCAGLAHAHSHGVIHRDIKPGNIMLVKNDRGQVMPVIVDFGIAKTLSEEGAAGLTQTGEVFGSPAYMSPEQCMGQHIDARSDIYSLGCTIFEMLTASPPFTADNALNLLIMQKESEAPSMKEVALGREFSQELEEIVARMLKKDPAARYQSIEEVIRSLDDLKNGSNRPQIQLEKTALAENPQALLRAGLLVASAAILSLSGYLYWRWQHPSAQSFMTPALTSIERPVNPAPALSNPSVNPSASEPKPREEGTPSTEIKETASSRLLTFPSVSIGTITVIDEDSRTMSQPMPARGTLRFRKKDKLYLQASWVATENFSAFKKLKPDDLSSLSLANLPISDLDLENIEHLTGLEGLHLYDDDEVTDDGLKSILKLANLKNLVLSGTHITAGGVAQLKSLKNLKVLNLNRISLDATAIRAIASLPKLYDLSLASTDLDDDKVACLAGMKSLYGLSLQGNRKVSDRGLRNLALHDNLYKLDLSGCNITPAATDSLKRMRFLNDLTVGLHNFTAAEQKVLHKTLPKCQITYSR